MYSQIGQNFNKQTLRNSKVFLGPHITIKLIKFYLIENSLPKSITYLINNYNITLIFSTPIFFYISHLLQTQNINKKGEMPLLSRLQILEKSIGKEREDLQFSYQINSLNVHHFKLYDSALTNCIFSHLLLSVSHDCGIYITSKQYKKLTKATYRKIQKSSLTRGAIENDIKNDGSSLPDLKIKTFQELFDEFIPIRLNDMAYDSDKYEFYISTGEGEPKNVDSIVPESLEEIAESLYTDKISPKHLIKDLGLTQYGKKKPKMKKIYKSLLAEFPARVNRFANINSNNSYLYYHGFKNIDKLLIHLNTLKREKNQVVVLGADVILTLLYYYNEHENTLPPELYASVKERSVKYTCAPSIINFISEKGFTEFINEFLLHIASISNFIKTLVFSRIYYEEYSPKKLVIYDPLSLSEEDYWNFYIQYHLSLAHYLNADSLILTKKLKKKLFKRRMEEYPFLLDVNGNFSSNLRIIKTSSYKKGFGIKSQKYDDESEIPSWNELFSFEYNFNTLSIPRRLVEMYSEIEKKSIEIFNSFWNSADNNNLKTHFSQYIEQIKLNEQLMTDGVNHEIQFDTLNKVKILVSDKSEYLDAILSYFEQVKYLTNQTKVMNSRNLYWIIGSFKLLIENYLRKQSSSLFNHLQNIFNMNQDAKKELQNLIEFLAIYEKQKESFPLKIQHKRKSTIQIVPNYVEYPSLIKELLKTFFLSHYIFSKASIKATYKEFKEFLKSDSRFHTISEKLSYTQFEKYLLELIPKYVRYSEIFGFYYLDKWKEYMHFAHNYYVNEQRKLLFKDIASLFNLTLTQVEVFIYLLLQNGDLFKPEDSNFGALRSFLLNSHNAAHTLKDTQTPLVSYRDTIILDKHLRNYFIIDNRKKNRILTQPLFWIFSKLDISNVIKSFYASPIGKSLRTDEPFIIKIRGQSFTTFLDSGSFISIMPRKFADEFFTEKKRKKVIISGVLNISKRGDFISDVEFYVKDQTYTDNFLLINNMRENFKTDIVLGLDAINKILIRNYGVPFYPLFEKIKQEKDSIDHLKNNKNRYFEQINKEEDNLHIHVNLIRAFNNPIEVYSVIFKYITKKGLDISDFDDFQIISKILDELIDQNSFINKRGIEALHNKEDYISTIGKVMCEIMFSKTLFKYDDLTKIYNCSEFTIKKIVDFLEDNNFGYMYDSHLSVKDQLNEYFNDPEFQRMHPSIRLLNIIRNELKIKNSNIQIWGGRVTNAELERQLDLGSGYVKKLKAKIKSGIKHSFDFITLEKFYKCIKNHLKSEANVSILAIKKYLESFSSKYVLIFNILIQFSSFLDHYLSLRDLSSLIHGKNTYLQNFLTGIDSKTGKSLDGLFLHSILHILHDIFSIERLDKVRKKKIKILKNNCYNIIYDWLVKEGMVYDLHSMMREFRIIFYTIHFLSLEKGFFFGPSKLCLLIGKNKQLITTKLREGTRFNRSQIKSLKFIVSKYFLFNQFAVSVYRMLNSYLMRFNYKNYKYKRNPKWNDPELIAEHFYILVIEQLGFDCLTLEPLKDLSSNPIFGWIRHHIDEDVHSVDPNKLALIQSNIHTSSKLLPHIRDKGVKKSDVLRIRARILYNRKIIRKLLFMNKKVLLKTDIPKEFLGNFQNDSNVKEFLNRRNQLKLKGEEFFFDSGEGIYKDFYSVYKDEPFWNSHKVNFI